MIALPVPSWDNLFWIDVLSFLSRLLCLEVTKNHRTSVNPGHCGFLGVAVRIDIQNQLQSLLASVPFPDMDASADVFK